MQHPAWVAPVDDQDHHGILHRAPCHGGQGCQEGARIGQVGGRERRAGWGDGPPCGAGVTVSGG
ncbi:hypothetical protein BQ8420_22450 [Nocardiopsis sp. JB363]|nr:hypothetical protein BQ8420_22450 [Nocardiopsis sp. JB363]